MSNRIELLREKAALDALSWRDSQINARLRSIYRLLEDLPTPEPSRNPHWWTAIEQTKTED